MRHRIFACSMAIVLGCGPEAATTTPERAARRSSGPQVADMTYVSEDRDDEKDYTQKDVEEKLDTSEFAVSTLEAVHEKASAAAEPHLDGRHEWAASPLLPSAWPDHAETIAVLYYPTAMNPGDLSRGELHSAGVRVTVALRDGAAAAETLKKRRLGEIVHSRPSRLEREEVETSERALLRLMMAHDDEDHGENHFWGYLKFFHEHPKMGKDIKKNAPEFTDWVQHLHDARRG